MYDSDYEYDVLGVLRLLRFVQMYRPHRAAHLVSGETAFSVEEVLEFLYYSMEEIFDDCYSDAFRLAFLFRTGCQKEI